MYFSLRRGIESLPSPRTRSLGTIMKYFTTTRLPLLQVALRVLLGNAEMWLSDVITVRTLNKLMGETRVCSSRTHGKLPAAFLKQHGTAGTTVLVGFFT